MEEYKARFSNEVSELLDGLESKLLVLEKNHQDEESIAELFRVIHTIKGTATMFGFSNIGKLTHEVEDVLHLVRDDAIQVTDDVLAISFDTVDLIRKMLETGDELRDKMEDELSGVLSRAKEIIGTGGKNPEKANEDSIKSFTDKNENFYYIRYQPDEDILSRGIDPLVVFEELEEEGKFTAFLDLTVVPSVEQFDAEKSFLAWDIFCCGFNDQEVLEDVFLFFLDHEFEIKSFQPSTFENEICTNELAERLSHYGISKDNIFTHLSCMSDSFDGQGNSEDAKEESGEEEKQSGKESGTSPSVVNETIRVDAGRLDELINLVSELVTINGELELQANQIGDQNLQKRVMKLNKLSKRFRDNALDLRLVPVDMLSTKMHRLIRDLSAELGKEIDFITEGTSTELDKSIVNRLEGPILHIIRNCVDHAIEEPDERQLQNKPQKGVVRFIAFYSGANVFIQIQDDGRGIDPKKIKQKAIEKGILTTGQQLEDTEAYNLIFEPGFSTAKEVTSVSGRGVGLDSVKKQIAEMRGQVDVESEIGLGTSFTIKLPLTLSIIDTLMTRVGKHIILVPIEYIVKTMLTESSQKRQISFHNEIIPFINMREILGDEQVNGKMRTLVIRHYNKRYAIAVDQIERDYQAVVKPLGAYNRHHPFFSGSSILGDGSLALILDINRLIKHQKQNKTQ